jgi:hypothetical protein
MKVTQHSRNQQSMDIIPIRRKQNTESSHGEEGKEGEEGQKEDKVEEVVLKGYAAQRPWRMPGPLL